MNGPGQQFLARARFALNEDGIAARRDATDRVAEHAYHRRFADHHSLISVGERSLESFVLAAQGRVLDRPIHDHAQLVGVERLLNVIERSELHRLHGRLDAAESGHENDRGLAPCRAQFAEQAHAVHTGHLQISDDAVERAALDRPQRLRRIGERRNQVIIARQGLGHRFAKHLVIIHDTYASHATKPPRGVVSS